MGKAQIQHGDVLQRINYLYQLAMESLRCSSNDLSLCRFYVTTLKSITQKHVLHLHPEMKRGMCKRCCVLLIPGLTAIVRTKKKRQKLTAITCLECGTIRRYVNNPHHAPRISQADQWEDRIVDGQSVQRSDQNKQAQSTSKKKNKTLNSGNVLIEDKMTVLEDKDTKTLNSADVLIEDKMTVLEDKDTKTLNSADVLIEDKMTVLEDKDTKTLNSADVLIEDKMTVLEDKDTKTLNSADVLIEDKMTVLEDKGTKT